MKKRILGSCLSLVLAASLLLGGCGGQGIDSRRRDGVYTVTPLAEVKVLPATGKTTDSQTTGSQTTDSQTTDSQTTDDQNTDGQTTDGQMTESQMTDGQTTDSQTMEGQTTDGQTTDGQTTDGQAADGQSTDGQTPDTDSSDEPPLEEVIGPEGISYEALETIDNTRLVAGYDPNERDELNRPMKAVNYQGAFGHYNAEFLRGEEPTILLVFTLGDDNNTMDSILDTLKVRGLHARFFVTGYIAKQCPLVVRRIIDEGHILGSHSFSHPDEGMNTLTPREIVEDSMAMQNYVREAYHYEMTEYAFPSGIFSERSLATICQLGYHTVFYSFAYDDYDQTAEPDPQASLERLLRELHPGSIYLLHGSSTTTASILGEFLDTAAARGYNVIF